jgi:ComF family protein
MLARAVHSLLDIVMPPLCVTCREPVQKAGQLFPSCWSALPPLPDACCTRCAIPLPTAHHTERLCLGCVADPPPFDWARAPYAYAGTARETVLRFKHGAEHLARLMAPAMVRAGGPLLGPGRLLIPVPLHRLRMASRGFNQSAALARRIARAAGAPLLLDGLSRVRHTAKTSHSGRAQRALMLRGAFAVGASARARIAGADVVLIDDVLTSGATAGEAARMLKAAGAASVGVLTYARVAPDDGSAYLRP